MKNSKAVKIVLAVVLVLVLIFLLMQCSGSGSGDAEPTVAETTVATEQTEAPIPTETEEEKEENEDAFTGSVTQKGAPALKGKLVIWDMVDEDIDLDPKDLTEEEKDIVVCEVPAEKLMMVPFAGRTGAEEEIQKNLEAAYTEILEAGTLAELTEDMKQAAEDSKMDLQKLVVRDLVDITLDEEYDAVLNEEENYIALTFELNLAEGEKLIVMTRTASEGAEAQWTAISGDEILYHEDGTVTVAFEALCPVAFVVEGRA